MKSKKAPVTFQSLAKLIGTKFDAVDKRFNQADSKILGIYGELDGIKQQVSQLDNKVETHRQETKMGFENIYEALGDLADNLDHNFEPRLKRLENKVFAQ